MDAYTNLTQAIENAAAGDTIWVARGTYWPTGFPNGGASRGEEHFSLKNGVSVYGGFEGTEDPAAFDPADRDFTGNETVLSGLHPGVIFHYPHYRVYHVFYHPQGTGLDETAVLDGFTISSGNAEDSAYPHSRGGGMFNYRSHPTIRNCTFRDNHASEIGGGVYNEESSPVIKACTFHGNTAENGAGIRNAYSRAVIVNSTFYANSAAGSGGGMANSYSQLTIASCTLFQNSAGVQGGGIYNTLHSSPVIRNSILHENSPDNLSDQSGAGSDVSCSLVQGGWPGEGNIDADPLLEPLSDNGGATQTCAIAGASPAYAIAKSAGGGDWNHAPDTDQRGVPRTFAGLRAMGAYEAPHAVLPGIYLLLF